MLESQAALEPGSIFALDRNKSFAGTPIETWHTMQDMIADIKALEERAKTAKRETDGVDIGRVTEKDAEELYRKYTFLKFLKERPRLGNPCEELTVRTDVWDAAHSYLGYTQSEEEVQYKTAFWRFWWRYSDDEHSPLFWDQQTKTLEEASVMLHHAYDEIWAFAQDLKLRELAPSQEQDRQKLESWIAFKVKELLVDEEHAAIRAFKGCDIWDSVSTEDIVQANTNVEARIAKGDWQPPGLQKFNFNGI